MLFEHPVSMQNPEGLHWSAARSVLFDDWRRTQKSPLVLHCPTPFLSKYAVSEFMGFPKGKLALQLFDRFPQLSKEILGPTCVVKRVLCEYGRVG